jgi:hypothetical protein
MESVPHVDVIKEQRNSSIPVRAVAIGGKIVVIKLVIFRIIRILESHVIPGGRRRGRWRP